MNAPVALHSGIICGDELPLIPEKTYDFGFLDYSTRLMLGKNPKLLIRFQIMDNGEHYGTILTKYYGLTRISGKTGPKGKFQVGRKSKFLRDFLTLFPDQSVKRTDRIPMNRFYGVLIKGRVRTVERGYDQAKIPKQLQYSVIDSLIKIKQL